MNTQYTPRKVLAFFAHPDDESFGPGGTIAKWASEGAHIELLCATRGEHGGDGAIREEELRNAAEVLGIQKIEFLDYEDGKICNQEMLLLEKLFIQKINEMKPDTILTFNLNGLTGHLDHMAVASAATQAFRKTDDPTHLYYFTLLCQQTELMKDYFVYFPEGEEIENMDEIIDVSDVWDIRIKAAHKHKSQKHDVKTFLNIMGESAEKEFFLLRTKK